MRRRPPPLRVTLPPPSRTTRELALRTFAVAVSRMVTGSGPHENVITPPAATARTTAADVRLAAVPCPTTRVGWDVSTARPSGGTGAWPSGLPAWRRDGAAPLGTSSAGDAESARASGLVAGVAEDRPATGSCPAERHAGSARQDSREARRTPPDTIRTARW